MKVLCERVQVVTYSNGSLGVNKCDLPRYPEHEEHHDPDKDLTWKKQ